MRDYQTTSSLLSYFESLSQRVKLGLKERRLCSQTHVSASKGPLGAHGNGLLRRLLDSLWTL